MTQNQKNQFRRGQALLLLLMMMAVIVTITGTAAYRATTQTKAAKESEESKKAYQGAVGYLEQALQGITVTPIFGLNGTIIPVKSVAQNENGSLTSGFTKKIAKDGVYTVYLYNYDVDTNTFTAPAPGTLSPLYYVNSGGECPVFELIFVSTANVVTRQITGQSSSSAPCNGYKITGIPTYSPVSVGVYMIDGQSFTHQISITNIPALSKLLFIRPYFTSATIGFVSTPAPQGRRVYSTARTREGAQKTLSVYQPNPQIPPELFLTSF